MAEDPRTRAHNEQMRQKRIARERTDIKKHGQLMDKVARGGKEQASCFGTLAVLTLTPVGLYLASRMIGL